MSAVKQFINARDIYDVKSNKNSSGESSANDIINLNNIQLPTLNLPSFDGSFDQWLFFRDSFNSIIHENRTLTNVQKFHYLRLSLKGAALETIKSMQICDNNYNIAWDLLTERFENKKLLVNNNMKALFTLPNLTKESHEGLRQLLDGTQKHLRSLQILGCPTEHWDDLIIYLTSTKFDNATRRAWETRNHSSSLPSLDDLLDFLKERCRVLESISTSDDYKSKLQPKSNMSNKSKSFFSSQKHKSTLCDKEHSIYTCPDFNKLTPVNRHNTAKRLRLCINCLSNTHATKDCKSTGCRRCSKIHHTLLQFESNVKADSRSQHSANENPSQTSQNQDSNRKFVENKSENVSNSMTCQNNFHSDCLEKPQILLSTALVKVFDNVGNQHTCRVLLDNGSQSNFISERLCNILHLPKRHINFNVSGINNLCSNINSLVHVTFKSNTNNFQKDISCLVLPQITGKLPLSSFDPSILNIPKNMQLADPNFEQPVPVDLLVGADTFWDLLNIGQVKLGNNLPTLHKTKLGWIISGPIYCNVKNRQTNSYFCMTSDINEQLAKFWEIEEYPKTKFLSEEETFCETHFKTNVSRNINGHFIVEIPLKLSPLLLGDSKQTATPRLLNLEKKLERNPDLKLQYHNFMKEYLNLGHMSLSKCQDDTTGFFLPHHCVLKESSTTTKLRVVFDGSCKSLSSYSLNDIMMVGPNIQDNLFYILLRFRKHKFVLTADITKMYRQVMVNEKQRYLQKILWRFNTEENISTYTLNTVTYGTASAAFLAIRALHEVAYRHAKDFPELSSIILHDFYVDDLLTGCVTIVELTDIKAKLSDLLLKYGFPLRKWTSNQTSLCDSDYNILQIGDKECNKTLGLLWNPLNDFLQYSIEIAKQNSKITKRQILSCTAKIFDPLGLISPVTITAKIILQELWKLKLSWDESIPMNLYTLWSNYCSEMPKINKLKIPRHVLCANPISVQLHGFCDASQSAYGACIYVRCTDAYGNNTSNLCCSKTRVAPVKFLSIPKLELCGALVLAELTDKFISSFNTEFQSVTYWTDSTTVIAWINTSPHLLKVFVANRVSQIQALTTRNHWKYVSSSDNPADLLSRGVSPSNIIKSDTWFHGPPWITLPENAWPSYINDRKSIEIDNISEAVITTSIFYSTLTFNEISKYSSLTKLKRIFAYVLRFKNNILNKGSKEIGPLSTSELKLSLQILIQIVQKQSFQDEYHKLSHSEQIDRRSKLLGLNPFFDEKTKLIRVGGGLRNSSFEYSKKHPALLPSNHHLTDLIARHEHLRLLHVSPQLLLASIREQFWPLSGRNLVKRIVHQCTRCFRFNHKTEQHQMGDLPASRVTPARPFLASGVDYAGPFLIRDRKGRNFKKTKAYISLFICFASKAIHLEVVSDLTTECFLAALRRFMSRRGKCIELFSDNGTTFVGANNEIQRFFKEHGFSISDTLSNDGVQWNFITPRAPHFGGLWEAGVKSVKYHLKRVIGNAVLTYEEFCTVLYQIEACLNSRPLYPLTQDPNDFNPLTPAQLIIGESLTSIPDHQYIGVPENHLSRFQRLQQLLQHFWSRWSKEYVSCLQQRVKWKERHAQFLMPNTLVLIKEDGLPPLKWLLGRIIKPHYGADGIIRSATIKTTTGEVRRPIVKICVLPNHTDSEVISRL